MYCSNTVDAATAITTAGTLHVTGTTTVSSTLSVTSFIRSEAGVSAPNISSSSDRSLKKNIKELGSATHQINKLRPVYFDWKE